MGRPIAKLNKKIAIFYFSILSTFALKYIYQIIKHNSLQTACNIITNNCCQPRKSKDLLNSMLLNVDLVRILGARRSIHKRSSSWQNMTSPTMMCWSCWRIRHTPARKYVAAAPWPRTGKSTVLFSGYPRSSTRNAHYWWDQTLRASRYHFGSLITYKQCIAVKNNWIKLFKIKMTRIKY